MELRLALAIPSEWERIDSARQAVGGCIAAAYGPGVLDDALAMVCAELLENAIKHGLPDDDGVTLQLGEEDGAIVIAVTNAVDESLPNTTRLRESLEWMKGFADPGEAYLAAMSQIYAEAGDHEVEGGLGLTRIAHEGGCRVDCDLSVPGRVTVRARRLM
jgi:anti-sigma regulatory factor (Ser/Thr protein kinase)